MPCGFPASREADRTVPPRRQACAAKTAASVAGVVVGLSEVERDTGLFAEKPCVMARRDQINVAGSGLELSAFTRPEPHTAETR